MAGVTNVTTVGVCAAAVAGVFLVVIVVVIADAVVATAAAASPARGMRWCIVGIFTVLCVSVITGLLIAGRLAVGYRMRGALPRGARRRLHGGTADVWCCPGEESIGRPRVLSSRSRPRRTPCLAVRCGVCDVCL